MNEPRGNMKSRWSLKYKKSINCSNPKGFSQKNYCKRQKRGGKYKTFKEWLDKNKTQDNLLKEVALTGNLNADLFSLIEMTNNLRSSIQNVAIRNPAIEQKLEELEKLAQQITISLKEMRNSI